MLELSSQNIIVDYANISKYFEKKNVFIKGRLQNWKKNLFKTVFKFEGWVGFTAEEEYGIFFFFF